MHVRLPPDSYSNPTWVIPTDSLPEPPILASIHAVSLAPERGDCTHFACSRLAFATSVPQGAPPDNAGARRSIRPRDAMQARENAARLRVHYLNREAVARRARQSPCRDASSCTPPSAEETGGAAGWVQGPEAALGVCVCSCVSTRARGPAVYLGCRHVCYMEAPAAASGSRRCADTMSSYEVRRFSHGRPQLNLSPKQVIESLLAESCSSAHSYCHHWEAGDFVVWDNRLAMRHNDMTRKTGPCHASWRWRIAACSSDCSGVWGVAQASVPAHFGRAAP